MRPLSVCFLILICGVPLGQAGWELVSGRGVQALELFSARSKADLDAFEEDLREVSFLHEKVSPRYQLFLTRRLHRGNEEAVYGQPGWWHLAADLDSITGRPYLDAEEGGPLACVQDVAAQLAERDIALLVVPVPEKTSIDSRELSPWTDAAPEHPDHARFLAACATAGIPAIDVAALLRGLPPPRYLMRDTHWTPRAMRAVAEETARRAAALADVRGNRTLDVRFERLHAAGDLEGMVNFPPGRSPNLLMPLEIERVVDEGDEPLEPRRGAPVLILGDSFTGAFSDDALGLGEHAGFAEHVALALSQDVDVIAIPGGSADAARAALARRTDGLEGVKLVIWQLSMRDLHRGATDDEPSPWRRIDLFEGAPVATRPDSLTVTAEIVEVSRIPPDFEYEFCLAVHEYRILSAEPAYEGPLWVAHVAEENFRPTPAATYELGARFTMTLEPIEAHHDLEATAWQDDTQAGRDIWFPVELIPAD